MKIKTHMLISIDFIGKRENEVCEFCGKQARYWTQSEGEFGKAHSRCVWHCRIHRTNARNLVEIISI